MNTRIKNFELKAENTYSFDAIDLKEDFFNSGDLKVITGFNFDQDTDNGAGKTTIAKIIYYAITGETLSGANVETVTKISTEGSKGAGHCVQIQFNINNNKIKIKRYRDWATSPTSILFDEGEHFEKKGKNTGLKLYINDQPWDEQSASSTQDKITNLIGATPKLFLLSIFSKQGSGSSFLNATDSDKAKIFAEFMDFDAYVEANKKCGIVITEEEKKRAALKQRIEDKKSDIESKIKSLKTNEEKRVTALLAQEERIKAETAELTAVEAKGKELSKRPTEKMDTEIHRAQSEAISKKISLLTNKLSENAKSPELSEIETTIMALEADLKYKGSEISEVHSSLAVTNSNIKALQTQLWALKPDELKHELIKINLNLPKKCEDLSALAKSKDLAAQALGHAKSRITLYEKKSTELEHSMECPTCKRLWDEATLKEKNGEITKLTLEISVLKAEEKINSDTLADIEKTELAHAFYIKSESLCDKISQAEAISEQIKSLNDNKKLPSEKELIQHTNQLKNIERNLNESRELKLVELKKIEDSKASDRLALKSAQDELSVSNAKIETYTKYNSEIDLIEKEKNNLREAYRLQKNNIALIKAEKPFEDVISLLNEDVAKITSEIESITKSIDTINEDLEYLEFCKEAFGPAGVRSFISDDLITVLNERVEEYLDFLYDGALTISFSSQSQNTKGVTSNKISTTVTHNGVKVPIEEVSGGENKRIELAVNLAIADVSEEYTGFNTGWRFMDEPFDGICQSAQLKCVNLLKKISDTKNRLFFIISHNPNLQQMVTNRVHIEKRNNTSNIVELKSPLDSKASASA